MEYIVKQVSSLEKIQSSLPLDCVEIHKKSVMAGGRFSYQLCIRPAELALRCAYAVVSVESELKDFLRLYAVKDVCLDTPYTEADMEDEDYLTNEPCSMPDALIPLEEQKNTVSLVDNTTLWIKLDVPADIRPGTYPITVKLSPIARANVPAAAPFQKTMLVDVIAAQLPVQQLIYTRWFYADCIAVQHGVDIFSEAHWTLIDRYIAAAADVGINMILVPVHTPPLDTAIGTARPCVQLVDIEKHGEQYSFSFSKLKRFIHICKKNSIRYYEIAHMFSQWGAKCAPNIMVTENGKTDYMFGWHVAANSPEYIAFLKQYIAAISQVLREEGISEQSYFHISDEPVQENMDTYKTASEIIRPLIGNSKTFDALSDYTFYENGLIQCPVTSVKHIHDFLEHDIPNQWAYYCCGPQKIFTNSFMAMPSHRTRILGYLLYKYNIKGFLHWGFNFYNSQVSYYPINPYLTTSADGAFPSGDPFIVYPGKQGAYPSIRGEVTFDAIQDMRICCALEEKIGRAAVVAMIDHAAGFDLRFDHYPKDKTFCEDLQDAMLEMLRENSAQ